MAAERKSPDEPIFISPFTIDAPFAAMTGWERLEPHCMLTAPTNSPIFDSIRRTSRPSSRSTQIATVYSAFRHSSGQDEHIDQ